MKLKDILKVINFGGLILIVYIEEEEDPIWVGTESNVPWWLAEHQLVSPDPKWGEESIDYRNSLGKEYNDEPGFVICLKDSD